MAKSNAFKIAREVYARFSDSDADFTRSEVLAALLPELENERDAAFHALAKSALDAAEESEKKKADSRQLSLFDVGGTLVLGEDRRRGLKYARRSHFEESLNIKRANAQAVVNKLKADEERYEALKPYWPDGRSYINALEEYLRANPQAESA